MVRDNETKKEDPSKETQEATEQEQQGVMEVEITLALINNKMNFIITKLDEISKKLELQK